MPSRPLSSRGGPQRPSTAAGPVFGHDSNSDYDYDYDHHEDDEDEDSESDDVFAFVPRAPAEATPSTPTPSNQEPGGQHVLTINTSNLPALPAASAQSAQGVALPQSPDSHHQQHPHQAHMAYPPPVLNPTQSRSIQDQPIAGPSSPALHRQNSRFHVETPPSTQSTADVNPYRMRRLQTITPSDLESGSPVIVSLPGSAADPQSSRAYKHDSVVDSVDWSQSNGGDEASVNSIKMQFDFDAIDDEDSPFPEVRASVSNIDDPEMPALTIRMWLIGLLLCMLSSACNVFFNFRSPAPSVVPLALLLLAYPLGKFLAFTLPITTYRIPIPSSPFTLLSRIPRLSSWATYAEYPPYIEFSLNPGPWNIKEHVLVFIMANVAVNPPYALNAIVVSEIYYDIELGYWFNLVLVLSTQLTGFGLAGMCRRFLVWPASMVWPQNLVACTLLNTLHAEDEESSGGITRYRFFMIVTGASFVFFFFPDYLFRALSVFSFICWIFPRNVPVNQLFGVSSGLGMSVITFDWTQISWIGSPLMVPWWAQVHIFGGFVLFFWILAPALYYSNAWHLSYFPISANGPYDKFGKAYNVTRVLKHDDTFDLEAYNNYSPLYLPATYAITYLLAFTLSTCVLVHTLLYHGQSLLNGIKKIKVEQDDIHAKLMRNYPEVPDWWYATSFVIFFCFGIIAVEVWHTNVPVWSLLLAVLLPVVYILPNGFIYAMTGQGVSLNLLAQIIPGTLLPGNPLANMLFKTYSIQTLSEATMFVQDLKLGHYVKVPPRATFLVQAVATTLAAFVQCGIKQWMFKNIHDICSPNQSSLLTCPHNQVFFTASAIWGLIGPSRQFGDGSIYHPQLYAIIAGAIIPIPFWLYQRRYPNSWIKSLNTPIILMGVSSIPPATGINYSSWFVVGFIFQYLIRRRNFAWWSKFNYVTSAALDSGTVISLVVIFFTLQFPRGGFKVNWWGNNVYKNTADYLQTPLRTPPPGGISA